MNLTFCSTAESHAYLFVGNGEQYLHEDPKRTTAISALAQGQKIIICFSAHVLSHLCNAGVITMETAFGVYDTLMHYQVLYQIVDNILP